MMLRNVLSLLAVFAFLTVAHAEEDSDDPTLSVAGLVAASGDGFDDDNSDFDILLAAVKATELVDALDTTKDITVFAPTDAAFIKRAKELGFTGTSEADATTFLVELFEGLEGVSLKDALLAHVVPKLLPSTEVLKTFSFDTLFGEATFTRTEEDPLVLVDKAPTLEDAKLIADALDIKATNGIVHAIDNVIIPFNPAAGSATEAPKVTYQMKTEPKAPKTEPAAPKPEKKCYDTFVRCAGAEGKPFYPYNDGCCNSGDSCVEAEWLGYGRHCLPTAPDSYKVGERCAGAPGKPYVPYAPCKDSDCVDAPDMGWGRFCVASGDKDSEMPKKGCKKKNMY